MKHREGWNLAPPPLVAQVNCIHLCTQSWLCPFMRCSITGSGHNLAFLIQCAFTSKQYRVHSLFMTFSISPLRSYHLVAIIHMLPRINSSPQDKHNASRIDFKSFEGMFYKTYRDLSEIACGKALDL